MTTLATSANGPVNIAKVDDRKPKTRRKMMFFDRAKVLLILALILGFLIAKYHAELPIISWGEAAGNQIQAKQWLIWLFLIECLRQIHYVISEQSKGWHQFWTNKFFGGWDRFWSRRNPWLRFRMARMFKRIAAVIVIDIILAALWGKDPFEAAIAAPLRIFNILFGQGQGLPFIIEIAMGLLFAVGQFAAIFWFMSRGGVDTYQPDEVDTRFSDVWGQDKVVEKVKENIVFLEKPEEIEAKGGHVPSGILLYGPPGTGKTLIAKAVAGETGRPYVFVDPGAFQNMFFGVGILKVKALFRKLRKLALRHGGVIVFFDEADSLGNRGLRVEGHSDHREALHTASCNGSTYLSPPARHAVAHFSTSLHDDEAIEVGRVRNIVATGLGGGGGGMGTLQALLTEMSGLDKPRGFLSRRVRSFLCMPAKKPPKYRILTMMATNAPDALDDALLRPGRIDRQYKVDYPTLEGRKRTFEGYLAKVDNTVTSEQVDRLALISPSASGAVVKDMVNEALIVAMKRGEKTVSYSDLLEARTIKIHGIPDDVHSLALQRHHVAIHEAGHALAFHRLTRRLLIDVATIEPRPGVGGFVAPVPKEERMNPWRHGMEADIMVSLGSLAAERVFYNGDNSTGVSGDLRSATAIASVMENSVAMGSTIAATQGSGDPTKARRDERVETKLQELQAKTVELVERDRIYVMAIAHALELHKTISGDDIEAIFEGREGPKVDGAWYQTQEFEILYSRYHAVALEAHVTEGNLDAPLPTKGSLVVMDRDEFIASANPTAALWARPLALGEGHTDDGTIQPPPPPAV